MAQISRKELKSDEFVSGMDAAYEFFLQHRDQLLVAAAVVVVVAVGAWSFYSWRTSRNRNATAMLAQGLNTLHAPLLGPTTPNGVATFASPATRAQAAAQQLQQVVNQYPTTSAGQLARYYLGLAQLDFDGASANKTLQAAASSGDVTVATAAKHALANMDIQNNKLAEAHALLEQLTHQDSATLPRAVALMELADLDRTYNPKEAATYYRELAALYPGTQTAQQAQQQLASLQP